MGRHAAQADGPSTLGPSSGGPGPAAPGEPAAHGTHPSRRRDRAPRRRRPPALAAVLVLALAAALTGAAVLAGVPTVLLQGLGQTAVAADGEDGGAGGAAPLAACEQVVDVRVTVVEPLLPALQVLGDEPLRGRDGGVCARVLRLGTGPGQTLSTLQIGVQGPTRPDVWVPDSSLWAARAEQVGVEVEVRGSLGTSPLVVASSPEVVGALGWREQPPTWAEVFSTDRALAVPALQDSAGTLMAIDAARGAAGAEGAALTVQAVLSRQRAGALTPTEGFSRAVLDGADAPLVLATEQEVARRAGDPSAPLLAAVGVRGGTPVLDHPVLAVAPAAERSPERQEAVELVLAALTGAPGQAVAAEAGLRGPDLEVLPGTGGLVTLSEPFLTLDDVDTAAVLEDLAVLDVPSRLLVVVDVSLSMLADVGDGFTRADVAARALDQALGDLPEDAEVWVWFFAGALDGERDWVEVVPTRRVSDRVEAAGGATTQRALLSQTVAGLPDALTAGGTGLYNTTEAALRLTRERWDPDTVSTVVLITDGQNERSVGLDLPGLQAALAESADPERPVGLVAVAFGPDTDLAELEAIAEAASAGGPARAVDARNPNALQRLLVELLAERTAG